MYFGFNRNKSTRTARIYKAGAHIYKDITSFYKVNTGICNGKPFVYKYDLF